MIIRVRRLLIGAAASCLVATGSLAQISQSAAYVIDDGTGTYTYLCNQTVQTGSTSSADCSPTAITAGTASATSNSSSIARTMSAMSSVTATSEGVNAGATATDLQYNAITVIGTPVPHDQLVFHFLTSQSITGSGGFYNRSSALWYLYLQSATVGSTADYVYQYGFGDGTYGPIISCSTQIFNQCSYNVATTASGFDMTLPFTSGGTFGYYLSIDAGTSVPIPDPRPMPAGATLGSSIAVQLTGVDAVSGQGRYIGSASFDPQTGLGAIDLNNTTNTTPEPNTIALLGTGLLGLVPVIRRKRTIKQ